MASSMTSPVHKFQHGAKRARAVEVTCEVSGTIKARGEKPTLTYIDVTFPSPTKLNYLVFRNYYTHAITIKHRESAGGLGGRGDEWRAVLEDYQLMKNCHAESDAQNYHCIDVFKTFTRTFDCFRVTALRIYISQPSPQWAAFALHDVKAYTVADVPAKPVPPPQLPPSTVAAATDVLSLVQNIRTNRTEFTHYDPHSGYLAKAPLEVELGRAMNSEIVELR